MNAPLEDIRDGSEDRHDEFSEQAATRSKRFGHRVGSWVVNLPMVRDRVPPRYRPALYFDSLYNLGVGSFFSAYVLSIVVITTILDGNAFHLALLSAMFGGSSLLSPLVSYCGRKISMRSLVVYPNLIVAALLCATAAKFGGATFFAFVIGLAFVMRVFPRVGEMNMYRILYPPTHRGAAVGWLKAVFAVSGLAVTLCGYLWFLLQPQWYWMLYCVIAVILVGASVAYSKIPMGRTNVFASEESTPPHLAFWQGLKTFLADRRFLMFQGGFALAGTANHMAIVFVAQVLKEDVLKARGVTTFVSAPLLQFFQNLLRFLQDHWGASRSITLEDFLMILIIGFTVAVLPAVLMIASTLFWGRVLDRINPMNARAIFNVFQTAAYAFYAFGGLTAQLWPFIAGASLHALGNGGGTINWLTGSLYFARPEQISLYNAVHVGLTGVRGLLAPLLGAYLLSSNGLNLGVGLFWISSALSLLGVVVMLLQGISDPGPREAGAMNSKTRTKPEPAFAGSSDR